MAKIPWLIAHRGANKQAPENTNTAFEQALRYPVDGLETDVQMTKDGIPVLYHDRTLFKVMKKRKQISDLTYHQLRELDWGSLYSSAFAKEPLLTLSEMLGSYAGRTRLMIEIKSRKPDQVSGKSSALTLKVLEELQKPEIYAHRKNIFVLSFDPAVLTLAHKNAPEFNYVLNLSNKAYDATGYLSILEMDATDIHHLYAFCVEIKNLSENLTLFAHSHGKKIMTYVCNNTRQTNRALDFNVDAVMTDDPRWITTYFKL
ncbi:MAG: glycerophosphodiester phosphodiesterase [Desulfobacterales bacterium]